MHTPKYRPAFLIDNEMQRPLTQHPINHPLPSYKPNNQQQHAYQIRIQPDHKYANSPKHAPLFKTTQYRPKSFLSTDINSTHFKSPQTPKKARQQSKSPTAYKPKSNLKMRKQSQNNIIFKCNNLDMYASKKQTKYQSHLLTIPQENYPQYESQKKGFLVDFKQTKDLSPFSKEQKQRKERIEKKKVSRWSEVNNFQFENEAQTNKETPEIIYNQYPSQKLLSQKDRKYSDNDLKKIPSFLKIAKTPKKSCSPSKDLKTRPRLAFNNFKVLRQLGKGSFGKVVLVQQKCSRMIFAIKIISKKQIIADNMVQQFSRELKIQMFLNHPNIIKVYGYFDDLLSVYIIMECALGGNIKDELQKMPLSKQEALASIFFYQVCYALSNLHKHTVIHRDLKIQNTILHEGVVKLCDFGWSVHRGNNLRNTFCGTPLYLCPEILVGNEYSQSIDIWSVGIMLYEMIYKENPFKITCEAQLVNILNNSIVFSEKVSASSEVKSVILKCLEKQSKDRPSITELMKFEFVVSGKQFFQLQK